MHEIGIATEIISIVEKEASQRGLDGIKEIKLKIGSLAGIDPEALKFGFEAATADTRLANARLNIQWLPARGKCRVCGREFEIDDLVFLCPHCESADVELIQGEELDIVHIIATQSREESGRSGSE